MIQVHPIPPGLFCVPAAMVALTGEPLHAVVLPALNRIRKADWLHGEVRGVTIYEMTSALEQIGWDARRHRGNGSHHKVRTWAALSAGKYTDLRLIIATEDHVLAMVNGLVYDTHTPFGAPGIRHPFSERVVVWVAALQRKQ